MAKEQFRDWNPKNFLRVKYKDGTGGQAVWEKNQAELLRQVVGIVASYQQQGIKLTNRQLYYQLVAGGIIPNADLVYKRICKFLTDARYAGLIDWEAIEDRGRVPEMHAEWESIKDLIRSAVHSYRLPRWADQNYYVELYCEKEAMESILHPIADKYHISFGYNKGYSSASAMYNLARRVKAWVKEGRKAVVLYLGDHDPSGLDMVRDIRERITEFLTRGDEPVEPNFEVIQLALHMSQVKKFNPPPNPAKVTDPRAGWYISKFGKVSWELDALRPEVLIHIAEAGIQQFLDLAKYNAWIALERKQKKALEDFGSGLAKEQK